MLRVCVIGMGPIGNIHAKVYKSLENVCLAGVCDRIPERARTAGETYNVPSFVDAVEMLEALKPDLVSIATGGFEYSSDHYEPTLQALEAGAHVLCEKPICNDLQKAARMVETAKRLNRCFALDFNHRFTPAAITAKGWQDEGLIGELLFININLWIGRSEDLDTEFYHLKALNPHSVDFARYFGGDIDEVQCFAMKASGRQIYSTASMNLKFRNNAVGHITSSYDIRRGHPMERCEIAGTEGRLVVEDMWRQATLYPADSWIKRQYTNPVFGGYGQFYDTFEARIAAFANAVDKGTAPSDIDGSGAAGLEASRVIHAAIESIRRGGQPVKVAEITK
ncbi:MAG TPA: Gfo/Idh/MocA family oxidoreductase [Clostridia bacterium]|nr:Gfo/Idh/MocA family oxidoreductase [Clostridia bacterium]